MNRVFTTIWNHSLGAWVVTSEHASRHGKRGAAARGVIGGVAIVGVCLLSPAWAASLPAGGQVVLGSGQIGSPSGNQLVIQQNSHKLAINWQSFDIGEGHNVTFNQPGNDAIALNRVLGADGSKIMGQLDANGRVFLINPNGVLFGDKAQVNVGGLVASTLDLSNSDFAAGNYRFKGNGQNATITNKGQLTATDGGAVALLGGTVSNQGTIVARQGSVALAAGNAMTLDFAGDGLLNVKVDEAVVDALAENHQLIKADGGHVLLTAKASDALLKTVVNNTGVIEAHTLAEREGKIVLLGGFDGGTVQVAGTLDASAKAGGNGGFIETSGAKVKVADSAKVTTKATAGKTGKWLIDPNDFTIAANGGDMSGAVVSDNLQNTDFEISTAIQGTAGGNGDIHVNDTVTWSANKLTLTAERNIHINADLKGSGTAKLAFNYGQGAVATDNQASYSIDGAKVYLPEGKNFTTRLGSNGAVTEYTVITRLGAQGSTSRTDLQGINGDVKSNYVLGADIDASSTSGWSGGERFASIGTYANTFAGVFDGLGHTVSGLTINLPDSFGTGMFDHNDGTIRNVGLLGGSVTGNSFTGGLVNLNRGTISNAYTTGTVNGSGTSTGGLVATNAGTINNAYTTGTVSGNSYVGGLAGNNDGTITNSYATGTVIGNGDYVNDSHAIGDFIGGLVGRNVGTISNAYATGTVKGNNYLGGLVGFNYYSGLINNTYATGTVTGLRRRVGGLVGENRGTIKNSYAAGKVQGLGDVGGLIGSVDGDNSLTNNYWSMETSETTLGIGSGSTAGVTGLSSAQMKRSGSFAGFDISDTGGSTSIWRIYEGQTTPLLRSFLKRITVDIDSFGSGDKTYDGSVASGTFGYTTDITGAVLDGVARYTSTSANAGTYSTANRGVQMGLYSGQQGFDISYVGDNASMTINKASLTATAKNDSKTYDGQAYTGGKGVTYGGFVNGEDETVLGGALTYGGEATTNANAGIHELTASGQTADNYDITYKAGELTIDKAKLTATAKNDRKTYDGQAYTGGKGVTYGGFVNGENESVLGGTLTYGGEAATNANAGTHELTASGQTAGNYDITYKAGALTIDKAKLTGKTNDDRKTYDGQVYTGGKGVTYDGFVNNEDESVLNGNVAYGGASQGAINAGIHELAASGQTADNYDITYETGALTIDKAKLTATAKDDRKTYDGQAYTGGKGLTYGGFVNGEDESVLGGTLTYGGEATTNANAGTHELTASGQTADNYDITYKTGELLVDKALLTVTAKDAQKTYDGQVYAGGNGVSYDGFVNNEDASRLGGTLAYGGNSQGAISPGSYGLSVHGLTAQNYTLTFIDGTLRIDGVPQSLAAQYQGALFSNLDTNVYTDKPTQTLKNDSAPYQLINHGIRLPEGI